jgi:hypothetical protein
MGKIAGFILMFIGALVCIKAWTDLDSTVVHVGTWSVSGALFVAGFVAWALGRK